MSNWTFALFFVGVAWFAYEFLGYPALLALVARIRRIRPLSSDDYLPRVSVLVSARNEERDILWKVEETLAWDYPADRLDILVASDASTDRTNAILAGIKNPRFRFAVMERRSGKSKALNQLAELAKGDLLFFSDANSHIDSGCLRRVVRHFADPKVGCVTGNSNRSEQGYQSGTSSGTGVYWGQEMLIRHLENKFGSVLVCDGALFCMRRSLYAPVLPELANDLELPLRIARAGFWILHEPTAQVLEKDTSSPLEEFRRRRRICSQGVLGLWRLRSTLRGVRLWQFCSHKVMRWLILVPLLLLLFSSLALAAKPPFAVFLAAQLCFYGAGLIGLALVQRGRNAGRFLTIPLYILVSAVGAFVGMIDAVTGKRYDIWESPALSRGDEAVHLERVRA